MDSLLVMLFVAAIGIYLFRFGKSLGSRQGFGVGVRRGRRLARRRGGRGY